MPISVDVLQKKKQYLKIQKVHQKALVWCCVTVTEATMSFFGITMKFQFIKDVMHFNMSSF